MPMETWNSEKENCRPCSVLLLNLDPKLKTERKPMSIREAEKQWNICRQKCLKNTRGNTIKVEPMDDYSAPTPDNPQEDFSEIQEIVIKEEPLSPALSPTESEPEWRGEPTHSLPGATGSRKSAGEDDRHSQDETGELVDKTLLSKLLRITRRMKSRGTQDGPNDLPTVEVKVEMIEPRNEENENKTQKMNRVGRTGINKEFLIRELLQTTATKSKASSMKNTSKTATVQPRILSKSSPRSSAKLSKSGTQPATTSLSVPSTTTTSQSTSTGNLQVPVKANVVSSSSPSTSAHIMGAAKVVEKISESVQPAAKTSSGDMSILQLMNGQLVLGPTETFKQISANTALAAPPLGVPGDVFNLPTIPPVNLNNALPTVYPQMIPPAVTFLSPMGQNFVTPTINPQLCNITPGLVGQQGVSNPVYLVPQVGTANTTLLFQPDGGQPNVSNIANYQPSSMQLLQTPIVQYQNNHVASPKLSEPITNSNTINATSYLRLADGQLVPIVSDPQSLKPTLPFPTTVKQESYKKVSSPSLNSGIPLTYTVSSNLSSKLPLNPWSGPATGNAYLASVPSPLTGAVNQTPPKFLQLQDGFLVPIIGQIDQKQNTISVQTGIPVSSSTHVGKAVNQVLWAANSTPHVCKAVNQNFSVANSTPHVGKAVNQNLLARNSTPHVRKAVNQNLSAANSTPHVGQAVNQNFSVANSTHKAKSANTASELLKKLVYARKKPNVQEQKQDLVKVLTDKPPITSSVSARCSLSTATASVRSQRSQPLPTKTNLFQMKLDINDISFPSFPRIEPLELDNESEAAPSVTNHSKTSSKRKSVNVVKEEYDVRKRKKTEQKKKVKDFQPQYVLMKNVQQPEYRPVLLDSTIEEKGIRLPDFMTI
ncbi:uncharacterized protein LOC111123209 [Crassostrea virginica]